MPTFLEKLKAAQEKNNSWVCVGLDPDIRKLPNYLERYLDRENAIFTFNRKIIDATRELVCAYKPNIAFYSAEGLPGLTALMRTVQYIASTYPEICIILDAKRGDIGPTAVQYAKEAFEVFGADAATVNPYSGFDTLEAFFNYPNKGTIVLCKTSNKGSSDMQDCWVTTKKGFVQLFHIVAEKIREQFKRTGNVGLVVGATYPAELRQVREIVDSYMPILIPGIGTQGGDLAATMKANCGGLALINSSSGILYAYQKVQSGDEYKFAEYAAAEAEKLRDQINQLK